MRFLLLLAVVFHCALSSIRSFWYKLNANFLSLSSSGIQIFFINLHANHHIIASDRGKFKENASQPLAGFLLLACCGSKAKADSTCTNMKFIRMALRANTTRFEIWLHMLEIKFFKYFIHCMDVRKNLFVMRTKWRLGWDAMRVKKYHLTTNGHFKLTNNAIFFLHIFFFTIARRSSSHSPPPKWG